MDSPSDISVLRGLLEGLNLPAEDIIDELEDEDEDGEGIKTYGNKDGKKGITSLEPSDEDQKRLDKLKIQKDVEAKKTSSQSTDDLKTPEEVEDAIGGDVDTCNIDDLKAALDKLKSQGRLNPKNIGYMLKNIQNTCAYDPVLDALRRKGYAQKTDKRGNTTEHPIIKKYANEIKELTIDATEVERDLYIDYISDPSKQIDFNPKPRGNFYVDAKATGIPESITNKLMQYVTTDAGNKGVGMGEFAMSLLFKNIGDAVGAGDLSLNGETFEIKGENATLGKRPDEINAIDVKNFAKYMVKTTDEIDDKDLKFHKEKRKTAAGRSKNVNVFYYKGKEVKKNTFADIMSDIYNNSDNKNGFREDFKEALRILDLNKKEQHSEAIDAYFDDIDFSSPQGVQNGIALLNFYRYILKEGFQHFLAHDFGKKGNNTGAYVYATGTAKEMVDQLMGVASFQAISPDNLKPRIGFNKSMREDLITKMFY